MKFLLDMAATTSCLSKIITIDLPHQEHAYTSIPPHLGPAHLAPSPSCSTVLSPSAAIGAPNKMRAASTTQRYGKQAFAAHLLVVAADRRGGSRGRGATKAVTLTASTTKTTNAVYSLPAIILNTSTRNLGSPRLGSPSSTC